MVARLIEEQVDIPADALGVDDAEGEHLDMHQLVLAVIEELLQALPVFLLEDLLGLLRLAGHPGADDGVHGVVGAAAVDGDPAQFLGFGPLGEFAIGTGMLDHVADLVRRRLVPAEVVIARVDDQDVALP